MPASAQTASGSVAARYRRSGDKGAVFVRARAWSKGEWAFGGVCEPADVEPEPDDSFFTFAFVCEGDFRATGLCRDYERARCRVEFVGFPHWTLDPEVANVRRALVEQMEGVRATVR